MMVIILRVMAVVAVTLGTILVVIAIFDPSKTAFDVIARGMSFAIVAVTAWDLATVRQRSEGNE